MIAKIKNRGFYTSEDGIKNIKCELFCWPGKEFKGKRPMKFVLSCFSLEPSFDDQQPLFVEKKFKIVFFLKPGCKQLFYSSNTYVTKIVAHRRFNYVIKTIDGREVFEFGGPEIKEDMAKFGLYLSRALT